MLRAFEARKGTQIAVLIVPTTKPEAIEQYSVRVVEQWKLGRKKVDDGALLLVAKDDRTVPPENCRMFYDALRAHKVVAHYLELSSGGHGLNGYKGPMWDAWQDGSLAWMAATKLVPPAK